MKRAAGLGFLFALLAIPCAFAQFTIVTGTVIDPNGFPYAGGTIVATLVSPGGTSVTLNGFAYTPPATPAGLNSAGAFIIRLGDNSILSPGGTQWRFSVCSSIGTVQPAEGNGPVCFTAGPLTISGSSQDISTTLQAAAVALTRTTGATTGAVPIGPAFYASTRCGTLPNCVQLVDDDATNNCGAALTSWIASINAYSGPGQPYVVFQMSGGGKAFLFSSCSIAATIPWVVQANATFDAGSNTSANLISFGLAATCSTAITCQAFRWNGGTYTGGASLTTALFEIKPNGNDSRLTNMTFINVGAGNATAGSCTNYAIQIDNPISNAVIEGTKYLRTDSVANACAYTNPVGTGGTNTVEFISNTIGFGGNCGSVGIWDGASYGHITGGTIFSAAIPIRLQGAGHRIEHVELDNNGCAAHGVQSPIQWGGPVASHIFGISISNVDVQNEVGSTGFLQEAGDDAGSTIQGLTLVGNKFVGRTTATMFLLGSAGFACSTFTAPQFPYDLCYAAGNIGFQIVPQCQATSTNANWNFGGQLADCIFNAVSPNLASSNIFTPFTATNNQNYLITVGCQVMLTQAATTSSTLPQCEVTWTDSKTNVAQTAIITPVWGSGTVGCNGTATNTVGNSCNGVMLINPKVGAAVSVLTINGATTGATPAQFQVIGTASQVLY